MTYYGALAETGAACGWFGGSASTTDGISSGITRDAQMSLVDLRHTHLSISTQNTAGWSGITELEFEPQECHHMLRQLQSLDAELQVPLFTPVHESVRQALVRHAPAACLNNRERNETGLDALGEDDYAGSLWRSPAGSSYMFDGNAFTCIAVHAAAFQAWVGRCAVRNVCLVGADGTGEQAFRAHDNPDKVTWVRIRLRFQSERVVKYFPEVASSFELTNGAVEVYTRVHHTHSGASQH